MLGLGVNEPIPSWGNMLGELQSYDRIAQAPWLLVPGILLVIVMTSLQIVVSGARTRERFGNRFVFLLSSSASSTCGGLANCGGRSPEHPKTTDPLHRPRLRKLSDI